MSLTDMVIMPGVDYQAVCDAVREKTGGTEIIKSGDMAELIRGIKTGGGDEDWHNDGDTYIWIELPEGKTTPLLGCTFQNGGVVDWGDGATDTVSSANIRNLQHNYEKPGRYVIKLQADDGSITPWYSTTSSIGAILLTDPRYTTSPTSTGPSHVYRNAIKKIEVGRAVKTLPKYVFNDARGLSAISILEGATTIDQYAFRMCYGLTYVDIHGCPDIKANAFYQCYSLAKLRFRSATPPSAVSGAFTGITTDCVISVPVGALEAYKAASYYLPSSTYTYIEE